MNIDEVKFQIVSLAYEIVQEGAHYLWGSAGDIPELESSGLSQPSIKQYPPNSGNELQIAHIYDQNQVTNNQQPNILAAETSVGNKKYICAGSYNSLGGPVVDFSNPEDANQLAEYLSALDGIAPSEWQIERLGFTPRMHNSKVVWGQNCCGVRHFDCVGLVNYCVTKALGRLVIYEIHDWAVANSGTINVAKDAPPANGDLLFLGTGPNYHHIALLYADDDGNGIVLQAADTDLGLTSSPYDPNMWNERRSITSVLLHD
ncbi:MAG: C40 family peptidase [Bacteroidetes bacterium]|nr:C40 family peptidase [Bacteroidota bacterium]